MLQVWLTVLIPKLRNAPVYIKIGKLSDHAHLSVQFKRYNFILFPRMAVFFINIGTLHPGQDPPLFGQRNGFFS